MKTLYQAYKSGILKPDRVLEAAQEQAFGTENPGFCINCGYEHEGIEPDARGYNCCNCGQNGVYGAEELVLMGQVPDDTSVAHTLSEIEGDLRRITEMG